MTWLSIQTKLYAAGTFLLAVLAFFVRLKVVTKQRDKARERAKGEAARADQAEMIAEVEAEIDNEFSDLERESKRDIEDGKMPSNIRNRNKF